MTNSTVQRVTVIVLDGVGAGEAPDAHLYGDEGSNTLANTAKAVGGLHLPHMGRLGLGNIIPIEGVPPVTNPQGMFGKMQEQSAGKDTTTGHWELAGIIVDKPFPTYPHGFPSDVIHAFTQAVGRGVLGNVPMSGTEIIERYGEQHLATGDLIVYTSADSVFQIAAHHDVLTEEQLVDVCRVARKLLQGEHAVGRVIARPFKGTPGQFVRTAGRRDFSLPPPGETVLDAVQGAGLPTVGIGKIHDIFAGRGVTESLPTRDNAHGTATLIRVLERPQPGFVFVNLVETDMIYGHRNDPRGFARTLSEFDQQLPDILRLIGDDVLIITADHGVDPTTGSTDHSREFVPLLVAGGGARAGVNLGVRSTFADVGATVRSLLQLPPGRHGQAFLP